MRAATFLVAACFLGLVITSCNADSTSEPTPGQRDPTPTGLTFCEVTNVIDGDTFDVEGCADAGRIRLILVDSPETHVGGARCFGAEATEFTRSALLGETVGLERDISDTDPGGRYLRYAWHEGDLFNERLVRQGYAGWYEWPPDLKHTERIRSAEEDARAAGAGLWTDCGSITAPIPGGELVAGCTEATAAITAVDKGSESVSITGSGALGGWYLVSERGNQRYEFADDFVLEGTVLVWSGVPRFDADPSRLWWTEEPMWNNSQSDPAALYTCTGDLASRIEDGG